MGNYFAFVQLLFVQLRSRRRPAMRWKWLAAGLAFSALLLFGAQRLLSHPSTYREAVAAVLDEREIAYREILVGEPCQPDLGYCFASSYRMSYVRVLVYVERPIYGRSECQSHQADCYLTLLDLHIRNAPLTDVAGTRPPLRFIEYGKAWLRERVRRLRGQWTLYRPEATQHSKPWPEPGRRLS